MCVCVYIYICVYARFFFSMKERAYFKFVFH